MNPIKKGTQFTIIPCKNKQKKIILSRKVLAAFDQLSNALQRAGK